jgi:predicted Na+-dependent transporter
LEAGPTPAAAIPIDGAVISDSENDSSAASGSSESEGDVAVAVAMAVAVKMVLVITTPMIMMMVVFLPQLTFLRELRELQLHPTLMRVLVGRVVRENP